MGLPDIVFIAPFSPLVSSVFYIRHVGPKSSLILSHVIGFIEFMPDFCAAFYFDLKVLLHHCRIYAISCWGDVWAGIAHLSMPNL